MKALWGILITVGCVVVILARGVLEEHLRRRERLRRLATCPSACSCHGGVYHFSRQPDHIHLVADPPDYDATFDGPAVVGRTWLQYLDEP